MKKLVFNIETIGDPSLPAELIPKMEDFEAPSSYKSASAIAEYKQGKVLDTISKLSLNPLTARIVALSMRYTEDSTITLGPDISEERMLAAFWANLEELNREGGVLVGYNSKAFDLPMIIGATLRLKVKHEFPFWSLIKYMSKYDQSHHFDVMTFLMNFELKKGNLGDWSQRLGGTRPYGKGNMVQSWYNEGDFDSISRHCSDNVLITDQIFMRFVDTFGGFTL